MATVRSDPERNVAQSLTAVYDTASSQEISEAEADAEAEAKAAEKFPSSL